jgi:hypothetical protein
VLREAHPAGLDEDTLTVEFPSSASFHRPARGGAEERDAAREALYEVTGRKLGLAFAEGEARDVQGEEEDDGPAGEEKILELVKETLDARERED